METWETFVPASEFHEEDEVLYSGLLVLDTDEVVPMVCLKEVGSPEIGGDYCWYVNDQRIQIGLMRPNENIVSEYIASPLPQDSSFDSDDGSFRLNQQQGFRMYAAQISANVKVDYMPYQMNDYK